MRRRIRELIAAAKPRKRQKPHRKHYWSLPEIAMMLRTPNRKVAETLGVSPQAVATARRTWTVRKILYPERTAFLALIFAAVLPAQTTIPPGQLRFSAEQPENLRVFAVGLSGMVRLQLGPGLRIEMREGLPTLVAAPVVRKRVRLNRDHNGNYPGNPDAEIFRNGILQARGEDYTTNSGGIIPREPWPPDDTITALYFEPSP